MFGQERITARQRRVGDPPRLAIIGRAALQRRVLAQRKGLIVAGAAMLDQPPHHTVGRRRPHRLGYDVQLIDDQQARIVATKVTRSAKTVAGYRSLLDTVILPRWKDTPLRDIRFDDLQVWITSLSERY